MFFIKQYSNIYMFFIKQYSNISPSIFTYLDILIYVLNIHWYRYSYLGIYLGIFLIIWV